MTILNLYSFDEEVVLFGERLEQLNLLIEKIDQLSERDQEFASNLIQTYDAHHALSGNQWSWVSRLVQRIEGTKPLYGNFKSIRVAFMIAGEHLKFPKVRLLTNNDRYVQLNFNPEKNVIKIFVDGWQGHGTRKFAGVIEDDMIKPYDLERLSDDVYLAIETLANDPAGAAKAFAQKLGACIFCGQRLSDPTSKKFGYGETCAEHYGLPYGLDLATLFVN